MPADFFVPRSKQIICAKENGVPFLFTGTGHGFYTGLEELRNGLEIYTAAFYHVDVDAEADEMTIGSSAVFKNISGALQAVGKNIRKLKKQGLSRHPMALTLLSIFIPSSRDTLTLYQKQL